MSGDDVRMGTGDWRPSWLRQQRLLKPGEVVTVAGDRESNILGAESVFSWVHVSCQKRVHVHLCVRVHACITYKVLPITASVKFILLKLMWHHLHAFENKPRKLISKAKPQLLAINVISKENSI